MSALLQVPLSFVATKRLSRSGMSRAAFENRQAKLLSTWIDSALPKVIAFAHRPQSMAQIPIMDKAGLMANFADYNRHNISADDVREAMAGDCRIGKLTVGASTGTSGNRGLFVISDAERYRWLGSIVAKTMGDLLWRKQRVAIILPQNTGLYDSANKLRQIQLKFFDLKEGPESWRDALEGFAPTIIVAPPKVLRFMIERGFRLGPTRVFSAAETLDPNDRRLIEEGFGFQLEQIYMATEGLLGVTCRHGQMHLAEDAVHFEYEPVGDGLVSPLISSFRRETQILARYRMNDLLRLEKDICPCGSPLQVVSEIAGRMDDCFHLTGKGGPEMITPDVLRNAILMADKRIIDFRLMQRDENSITLVLSETLSADAATAAKGGLRELFQKRGLSPEISVSRSTFPLDVSRKLRRVENQHGSGQKA